MRKVGLQISVMIFLIIAPLIVKLILLPSLDYLVILSIWIPSVCITVCFFSSRVAGLCSLLYFAIIAALVLTSFDFSREAVTSHKFISLIGNQVFYGVIFSLALIMLSHFAYPYFKRLEFYKETENHKPSL